MSFSVRIFADLVSVEAGATMPLGIEIANRSDDADRFELEVEGLDPDWTAVPVPTFAVDPRDIQSEKVFFKPPRVSESLAGTYPFVIKVRSLVNGEVRTAQGILEIKPYHHLTMELTPKKGVYSAFRKSNVFQATIMNLGNTDHTLQVFASDPEDALAYEIEHQQISIGPGQTRTLAVTPKPTAKRAFSGSRLHGFTVSTRSIESPAIGSSAQAQLEERPAISPASLFIAVLFLLVFAGWYALLPKPPQLNRLTLTPIDPVRGQSLKVEWTSTNATSVQLTFGGRTITDLKPNGEYSFTPEQSGTVEAVAIRDGKVSSPASRSFIVRDPEPVLDPEILSFDITPKTAKPGDTLLVKYKLGPNVQEATLEPSGITLDKVLEQVQITADIQGNVRYTLVAKNQDKVARKSVTVSVVATSDASIVVFRAEPLRLVEGGGRVVITWQFARAERRELKAGDEPPAQVEESGTRDYIIDRTTEFTITGYDAQGRTVSRTIKVEVAAPSLDSPEPPPAAPVGAGGGQR